MAECDSTGVGILFSSIKFHFFSLFDTFSSPNLNDPEPPAESDP